MTRALVTGGSGFIGQHLVAALLAQGRQVRVLDLRRPAAKPAAADYVNGSILDARSVREAMADVEEVYHLAGLPGMWVPRRDDFHAVNGEGTAVVIAAARQCGVRRLLHCSTESILFRPPRAPAVETEAASVSAVDMPGAYTRSKWLAEQHAARAAARGDPVVIATPTIPIGAADRNATPPTAMLRHFIGRRVQFYLDFVLNLVDVRDVAVGLVLVMQRGRDGERYILGGEDVSLRNLLALLDDTLGRRSLRIAIPTVVALGTAALMEAFADHVSGRPPAATVEAIRIAARARPLSSDQARRELGYAPRPIGPALRAAIAALQQELG